MRDSRAFHLWSIMFWKNTTLVRFASLTIEIINQQPYYNPDNNRNMTNNNNTGFVTNPVGNGLIKRHTVPNVPKYSRRDCGFLIRTIIIIIYTLEQCFPTSL